MSFVIQFDLEEVKAVCNEWQLFDTTGDTTGGWSDSGNPARNANSTITFYILQNGFTAGYLITLTTVAGIITGFTITDPAGVVTDWLSTIPASSPAFTSDPSLFFSVTPAMIGLDDTSTFVSTAYYFEENITIAGTTYTTSENQLITCSHCCCMEKAKAGLCDCDCKDSKANDLMWATILTDSALEAIRDNNVPKAVDMLDRAKKICGNKCNC